MSLIPVRYHNSWEKFLTKDNRDLLDKIEREIGNNYTPSKEKILRFMTLDLNKIKIICKGMDPYKAKGVATGRAFEVDNLTSWYEKFRQISLKNMVRLIHKNYSGIEEYDKIYSFCDIQSSILQNGFSILPPKKWFNSLENQGVLFLNTYLTCEIGKSNSHKDIWKEFSERLVTYISIERPDIIWFLWGKEAQKTKDFIKEGKIYDSRHPMMCSKKYEDDFLKSNCFKDTMDIINWLG